MDMHSATELLKQVVAILDEARVPAELRPTAFEHVWRELSQTAQPGEGPASGSSAIPPPADDGGDDYGRVAARLKLNPAVVGDVYEPGADGALQVVVPSAALNKTKTVAQRELALLLCAARQATIEEQATEGSVIRQLCEQYGKLDAPNFAQNMKEGEHWWIIGGTTQKKTYKLRTQGWEAAAQLVGRITDGS